MGDVDVRSLLRAWSWGNDIFIRLVKATAKQELSVEDTLKWLTEDQDAMELMLKHLADELLVKQDSPFLPSTIEGHAFFRVRTDHLDLSPAQVKRSLAYHGYELAEAPVYSPEPFPFLVVCGLNENGDFKLWDSVQRYKGHTHKCTRRYWILAREKKPA